MGQPGGIQTVEDLQEQVDIPYSFDVIQKWLHMSRKAYDLVMRGTADDISNFLVNVDMSADRRSWDDLEATSHTLRVNSTRHAVRFLQAFVDRGRSEDDSFSGWTKVLSVQVTERMLPSLRRLLLRGGDAPAKELLWPSTAMPMLNLCSDRERKIFVRRLREEVDGVIRFRRSLFPPQIMQAIRERKAEEAESARREQAEAAARQAVISESLAQTSQSELQDLIRQRLQRSRPPGLP